MKRPLADRLRPEKLDDLIGQEHLTGPNGTIRKIMENGYYPNMVFYGPPGTGKTSLAWIIAKSSGLYLKKLNATTATTGDIKDVISETNGFEGINGILLYLDEIQYFSKKQQQTLLEFIEDGRITLIASTTENPYLYVYHAIISRSSVFEFHSVSPESLTETVRKSIKTLSEETGHVKEINDDAVGLVCRLAAGDVRRCINICEEIFYVSGDKIDAEDVKAALPSSLGNFDKSGTVHYDLLSCLQKSIRGSDPDAAVFYLSKILSGGDLPGACRRLQVIACEDIGLAYPQVIPIVRSCVEIARDVGLPEAVIPLSDAAILLATSPKSNSGYAAYEKASADSSKGLGQKIPPYLRPGNRYEGYKYPHDFENHYVKQQYLPDELKDRIYYEFGDNRLEQSAKQYWEKIKG